MKMQQILSPMRRAIEDFDMISAGDRIAVGLSGGKDSSSLLCALKSFQKFSPKPFELAAVTIDIGMGSDYSSMIELCERLEVPYFLEKTDIGEIIFNVRKESNPCSLCSKMRRGALCSVLQREGYNKLAYAHHADDVAETFLMSLFYEGRLNTFKPVSKMSRSGITLIRPFVYANEKDIVSLCKEENIPIVENACPANHQTNREYMKQLIKKLDVDSKYIASSSLKKALFNPERNSLWPEKDKKDS